MASVTFEHVWKRFGASAAVRDLSLEIEDREFLVLVGPSGCGKSTTLRMLAGLEAASEGVIRIGDRVVNDVPPKDRDIAMVFQSYALYPHMTVFDNMAFGLSLRGVPKAEIRSRVAEAATILGINELLERKPRQLSGGQRQRVALGRAIVRDPAVFLLDEPLSNLDAQLRVQTRAELSKLHERLGTTFVYVTHDQVEAMTMATRIAVMSRGVLEQVGRPIDVYERPANQFVAGFIGSPAMNFLEADVVEGEGLALATPSFRLPAPTGMRRSLGAHRGHRVVLGVRPEHIHLDGGGPERVPFEALVEVVEELGSERLLHVRVGETLLVARVPTHPAVERDKALQLTLEAERVHAFEPETGAAIRDEAASA